MASKRPFLAVSMLRFWVVVSFGLLLCSIEVGCIDGSVATEDDLVFGHLADEDEVLSSTPSISTSTNVALGIRLAFAEYNRKGGFCNSTRELVLLPKVGQSWNTSDATYRAQQLVNQNVLAFLGTTGPASLTATYGWANNGPLNIPSIAPLDSSWASRNPSSSFPSLFHLRASQMDEALAVLQFLRFNRSLELLALIYEDSVVEPETVSAIQAAASATGFALLVSANCVAELDAINQTLNNLFLTSSAPFVPEGLIVIGRFEFASLAIQTARQRWSVAFGVVSDSPANAFLARLGGDVSDIVLTQVMPTPFEISGSTISDADVMEGYLAGQMVITALNHFFCDAAVTPSRLAEILRQTTVSLTDNLSAGPFTQECNQGLRQLWIVSGTASDGFSPPVSIPFPRDACHMDVQQLGPKAVVFGQSAVLSGVTGGAGIQYHAGITAAFYEQNQKGGIDGHPIHLIALNDGYLFPNAQRNTNAFLNGGVFGLIGYTGTGVSVNVAAMVKTAQIPFVGPYSGSTVLRTGGNRHVINIRASYADEINAMVNFLINNFDVSLVSIFYQNDAFGLQGVALLASALKAVNLHIISNGSYPVNTLEVEDGLNVLLSSAAPLIPEAIVVWGSGPQASKFIHLAQKRLSDDTIYLCASIVGEGFVSMFVDTPPPSHLYVTQVCPLVTDLSYAIVRDYRSAMGVIDPNFIPSMVSLEGYINARLVMDGLGRVPPANLLDRSALLNVIYDQSFFRVSQLVLGPYTEDCNQGLRKVWFSKLGAQHYEPLSNFTFSFGSFEGGCFSDLSSLKSRVLVFGQSTPMTGPLASMGLALQMGFRAAFAEENLAGDELKYRLVTLDDAYTASLALANTQHFAQRGVLALVGYCGSEAAEVVAPFAATRNIPFLSPLTGSMVLRNASLSVLNIRASYVDEINAMVDYVVSTYGLLHFSLFYQADAFGRQGVPALTKALAVLGHCILSNGSYMVNDSDVSRGLDDIQRNAGPVEPSVIVVWAIGPVAARFILAAQRRFSPEVLYLCPSISIESTFLTLLANSTARIFSTQILPPLYGSNHPLLIRHANAIRLVDPTYEPNAMSFEGYVNALVLATVLKRADPQKVDRPDVFMDSFYSNVIFSIDSLTVGPYKRKECNQGLRTVWMTQFNGTEFVEVPSYLFDFTGSCLSDPKTSLHAPIIFGHAMDATSCNGAHIQNGLLAIRNEINRNGGISGQTVHFIPFIVSTDTTPADFSKFLVQHHISGMVSSLGPFSVMQTLWEVPETNGMLIVSATHSHANRVEFDQNPHRIGVGGSPLDEAYAVTRFLRKRQHMKPMVVFESGRSTSEIVASLQGSATEMGLTLIQFIECGRSNVDVNNAISGIASSSADAVIVAGSTIVVDLVAGLARRAPSLPILIMSSDFEVQLLQQRLPPSPHDVYITTFLPFIPAESTDDFGIHCQNALQNWNGSYTPTSKSGEGCLIGIFVREILDYSEKYRISPLFSTDAVYGSELFSIDGFRLGPFANSTCKLKRNDPSCECDQGSHTVWLIRVTSTNGSATATGFEVENEGTVGFDTCGVKLAPVLESATEFPVIAAGVITGFALFVVIATGVAIKLLVSRRRLREEAMNRAPRGHVAVAFTDVQDSTKLWDICHGMKEALELHNDMMRRLIEKHEGYEVKTQGDSFMVAFATVDRALSWALEVQDELLFLHWPGDILEQGCCSTVRAIENNAEGAAEREIFLFRGLRVRVGIHCGFPELEYNPRTNTVDYFGPIVNGAARIEALGAGGQILMSSEAQSLVTSEASRDVVFTPLGGFPLKGMITEQEVFQVSSKKLSGRQFPPIDPRRVVVANAKGQPTCEKCNRPLQCLRCVSSRRVSSPQLLSRTYSARRRSQTSSAGNQDLEGLETQSDAAARLSQTKHIESHLPNIPVFS